MRVGVKSGVAFHGAPNCSNTRSKYRKRRRGIPYSATCPVPRKRIPVVSTPRAKDGWPAASLRNRIRRSNPRRALCVRFAKTRTAATSRPPESQGASNSMERLSEEKRTFWMFFERKGVCFRISSRAISCAGAFKSTLNVAMLTSPVSVRRSGFPNPPPFARR